MNVGQLGARLRRARYSLAHKWNTSLQVRVIGSIFVVCAVVVVILGFTMMSIITQRLAMGKLDIANSEIDRARITVEQQIAATDSSNSLQVRINAARAALTARSIGGSGEAVAVYEPVVVVNNNDGTAVTSPEGYQIPLRLRYFVAQDQVSYQYAMVDREDGTSGKALIIGTPTSSEIPGLQVYLVLSMNNEDQTLALMRGLFSAGGVLLIVLLVGISWLLTQQITGPVRAASRIAQRFADGHFRERMVVDGEDEMARMAMSFNAMAEELSKKIEQLKEYGALQRQFTSDVSHELRTPLTTVRMAADMIAENREELDPLTRRASELLVKELDHFEALLADLLEISRHDAGVADLSATRIDMYTVIEAAWQKVHHLAQELGVDVLFDIPPGKVMATVDPRRIERILRNLLSNAIDHSEGKPVLIRLRTTASSLAVGVYDNGVGLKPGQEELVFERFWRADPSRKRHSGGTGLGLAIAKEDALLHGGCIDVVGELGRGSMFRLMLPREPGHTMSEPPLDMHIVNTSAVHAVHGLPSRDYAESSDTADPSTARLEDAP